MADVIAQVGTPLQLAALGLILLAGLARVLIRAGRVDVSAAMGRMIVNRLFVLALVALGLGLGAPVVASLLPQADTTYHGSVRSTAGGGVPGATVEALSVAQTSSNTLGQFDLVVPRSRVLPQYRVQASAPGFKPSPVLTRSAAEMRSLEIELEPLPRYLVPALEQPLLLGQFFGSPFVLATLRVENPAPSVALITDIRATLAGPDRSFTLNPAFWTIAGQWGPYASVAGPIPVFAGAQLDLRILLTVPSNIGQLMAQMGALPEYKTERPCQSTPTTQAAPLSPAAFDLYKAFATQRFAWTDGVWRLSLDVVSGAETRHFTASATLTAADLASLRSSVALGRNCLGVSYQAPLGQDGQLANFVVK